MGPVAAAATTAASPSQSCTGYHQYDATAWLPSSVCVPKTDWLEIIHLAAVAVAADSSVLNCVGEYLGESEGWSTMCWLL